MAVEKAAKLNVEELRGKPLGRVLVRLKAITRDQVQEALEVQKAKGGPLGQILIDLGYIDEDMLRRGLGYQAGMDWVDLEKFDIPKDVISQIPAQMAMSYKVLPISFNAEEKHLTVAVASSDNFHATDDLRTLMGFKVTAKVTSSAALDKALSLYYDVSTGDTLADLINEAGEDESLMQLENRGESIDMDTITHRRRFQPRQKAGQHGAAPGHPRQGLGHPLRALRR